MVGCGLLAGLAIQAFSEATGERWAGHELSPGPPTPSGPGADQGGPGAGVVWPRPWRAREAGRRGTEDTRTL